MLSRRLRAVAGNNGNGAGVPSDYIAFYTMDNISGTTLVDEVGIYDGTINGATQVSGYIGQALDFDGTNDWVDLPVSLTSNVKSMSMWINPDNTTSSQFYIMHRNSGTNTRIYALVSSGTIGFYYGTGLFASTSVSAGQWQHIVMNFEPGSQNAYLDGVLVGSGSNTFTGSFRQFVIGRYDQGDSTIQSYANGKIDQCRFYDRFLDASEITALYNEV